MGKRAAATRPSDTPRDQIANPAIREKAPSPHKRRASSTSQSSKNDTTSEKIVKSNLENKERAYVAASRRMDRSLEDRIKSAQQASEVHFERTGKHFRITKENVEKGLWYDEIDEVPRHRLSEHQMDAVARARYQEVDAEFSQVFGKLVPSYSFPSPAPLPYQFSAGYPQYPAPQRHGSFPMQQQPLPAYPGLPPDHTQPVPYTQSMHMFAQQAPPPDDMTYPWGSNGPPPQQVPGTRRSISPASSSSREPATSVSPVSMGSSSNPTSPESEIDSSAAEALANASRTNSFDNHLTTSNSPMLAQNVPFPNFTTAPSSTTLLSAAIDPELHHSPPTAYFENLGFEDMTTAAYPELAGFDFSAAVTVPRAKTGTPPAAVPDENGWDDLIDTAGFEEVAVVAQGAQGWAHQR